jgi:hypothetical protein
MVDGALHRQWIATASTVVVGEEAGVPPIVVVVQEGFLGGQNTGVMFFSCFSLILAVNFGKAISWGFSDTLYVLIRQ